MYKTDVEKEKKYPPIVQTFLHFFWVSTPKLWMLETKFEGYFLHIKIISDKTVGDKQFYLRRKYSLDIMNKFQDTIIEVACDCAAEVVAAMNK